MRRTLLAAALAVVFMAPAAEAAIVEQFKVADWDAAAFTSDETGLFTHCSVYAEYQNGTTLYISSETSGAWYLSVSNPKWTLTEGGQYAIRFRIDRRDTVEGTTDAIGTDQLGLPIEADHAFIRQLRRGNRLTMTFQNTDYFFELSNSNKAMDTAQECVRRHLALGTTSPVMSKPGTPPEQQQTSGDTGAAMPGQPTPPPQSEPEAETQADSNRPADADTQSDAAATAVGEQQAFGQWVVTAANNADGSFANCTAYNVQGDDQLILSLLADQTWEFGFYRAAWTLDTNATYYLWYNIDKEAADGTGVVKHPAEAVEPTRIWFAVSESEDIIDRIEHGSTLFLQLHSLAGTPENYSFALAQAPEAFAATRQCVTDHLQEATDKPSKEGSGVKGPETETADSGASSDSSSGNSSDGNSPDTGGASSALPAMGFKKIEDLTVAGWTAAAFSQDDDTFTHCGIKAEYQNGATFGVARAADGDLVLAVQHDDFKLTEGASVPLTYTLTGGTAVAVGGTAIASNVIMANVGSDEELTMAIHDAKNLTLEAEGKSLAFDISDIGPGIEAIDECVARHAAATPSEGAAPVPAAKKAEVEPTPPTPAPKANSDVASTDSAAPGTDVAAPDATSPDATEQQASTGDASTGGSEVDMRALEESFLTMGVLMKAGYFFEEVPAGTTIPAELPESKTAWKLQNVIGVTMTVDSSSPDDVKSSVTGAELQNCGGMLTSQIITSDNAGHMHFSMKCGTGVAPKIVHYVVLPREAGGSYVLAILGNDDGTEAGAIAQKVYDEALKG